MGKASGIAAPQAKQKSKPPDDFTIDTVRRRIKRRKRGLFAPIADINVAEGKTLMGPQAME